MEPKTRVNITDPLRLRRIEVAKNRIGAATATKAACALLDEKLTEMGIPLMPDESAPANQPAAVKVADALLAELSKPAEGK